MTGSVVLSSCHTAVFFSALSLFSISAAANDAIENTGPPTTLILNNRSSYEMHSSIWTDGYDCSGRILFDPPLNINNNKKPSVTVPGNQQIAVGVAIYAMQGKLPVTCDYIVSFALDPSISYTLEFDVHDRRCYGQLFRQLAGKQELVLDNDPEIFEERFPEFGWDQFEPGCMVE